MGVADPRERHAFRISPELWLSIFLPGSCPDKINEPDPEVDRVAGLDKALFGVRMKHTQSIVRVWVENFPSNLNQVAFVWVESIWLAWRFMFKHVERSQPKSSQGASKTD